jgi:hypothetical protein
MYFSFSFNLGCSKNSSVVKCQTARSGLLSVGLKSTLIIQSSTVDSCLSQINGGVLFTEANAYVMIEHSLFPNNQAAKITH